MAKGIVEPVGRSQAIGRPVLYGTTDLFLKNFGFSSLKELPEIEDIEYAVSTDEEVQEDEEYGGQLSLEL